MFHSPGDPYVSKCWCVYIHNSPNGFFWAECEFPILLDRSVFSIIRSSCWYVYFLIHRMDSFEQEVSFPFSWIVMFSIIRSSCWCVYFIIPWMDSFGQRVPGVSISILDCYVFDYSQQLLMCIFHNYPDGFFWAESEFPILLDRYFFDSQLWYRIYWLLSFLEWWMDVISVKWVPI